MECPPEVRDLLKALYGLSSSESEVLVKVCQDDWRTSDLAKEIGKDRSTVQRYLSSLKDAGLIDRKAAGEEGKRGRYYVYSVKSEEELKQEVRDRMKEWEEEKLNALEEL